MSADVDHAITALQAAGYVVLREKSYQAAQERQRIAEARKEWAEDQAASREKWARDCLAEERRLRDRIVFVYGVARAHGATEHELAGPEEVRATAAVPPCAGCSSPLCPDCSHGAGTAEVWIPPVSDCMEHRHDKPCPHCHGVTYHHRTRRCGDCGRRP